MNLSEIERIEKIEAWLDGLMSLPERRDFEALLADSPDLQDDLALTQEFRAAFLPATPEICPDHVVRNVMLEVDADIRQHYQTRLRQTFAGWLQPAWRPALALTAVALMTVAVWEWEKQPQPKPALAQVPIARNPAVKPDAENRDQAQLNVTTPEIIRPPVQSASVKRSGTQRLHQVPSERKASLQPEEPAFSDEEALLAADQARWVLSYLGLVAEKTEAMQQEILEDHVADPVRLASAAPFEVLGEKR